MEKVSLLSSLAIPKQQQQKKPTWFSPETGIYRSTHAAVSLPSDPDLDLVSFLFSHHRHHYLPLTALLDSSTSHSISYNQLFPLVKSVAFSLNQSGLRKGDVVLFLLPNSIYFPVIFFAVLYIGALVTTMNPLATLPEINSRIADCGACLAFASLDRLSDFRIPFIAVPQLTASTDTTHHSGSGYDFSKFGDFHRMITCSNPVDLGFRPPIQQQDTAAIIYSSGTTGPSKGALITHGNLIAAAELFVRFEASMYDSPAWENVYLAVLPMFHIYGLVLFVTGLLSLGSTIVVMKKFDVDQVINAIQKHKVTHFPVVPPILSSLAERAKGVCENVFKSLKQVSCGAAPSSAGTIQTFLQTFPNVDFIQGYGMTESTAVGTRGFNTKRFEKYSSAGLLAPNTEAKVVDCVSGRALPPGSVGELWMRGPGTMKGYLNNPETSVETVDREGWLHTGDIVCFDDDGYLYIFDRLKEMIKYKGFQIAPADLEAVLITHPHIIEAVVAGIDAGKDDGEIPAAFVVRRKGSSLTEEGVMKYVANQVAPYKKVRRVIFTESIPRSPAGKILRRQLKNMMLTPTPKL
ncbi:4-coumarate--CoA ligase-like 6 [Linum grandiflorum]